MPHYKVVAWAAFASMVTFGRANAQFAFTPAAYSSQTIPGLGGPIYVGIFNYFSISPHGSVTFLASRAPAPGVGPTQRLIVRVDSAGQTSVVADPQLHPVSGVSPSEQGSYYSVACNADDAASFGSMDVGFGGFSIVNAGAPGSPSAIARIGSPVAGSPGSTFSGAFYNLMQGPGGTACFIGNSTGNISGRSLWAWSPATGLQQALVDGQPVAGGSSGPNTSLSSNPPFALIGQSGLIATTINLSGNGVISGINDIAVVRGTPGAMSILARRNDPTGLGSTRWNVPSVGSITPHGSVTITDQVTQFGSASLGSVWIAPPSAQPQLVAITGTTLPSGGGSSGQTMRGFGNLLANDNGQMAFLVGVDNFSPVREAIVVGSLGNLRTAVLQGAQIPGMPAGTMLTAGFAIPTMFLSPTGQVAFTAPFTDPALPGTTPMGLWTTDQLGNLQLITRSGASVQLAPGVFRTISDLYLPQHFGVPDASSNGLSDSNRLVFEAAFTDGTYALMTTSVPAPSAGGYVCLLGVLAGGRRRRAAAR